MTKIGIGLAIVMALAGIWLLFGDQLMALISRGASGRQRRSEARSAKAKRPSRDQFRSTDVVEEEPPPPLKKAAIILNPSRLEAVGAMRARMARTCLALGWDEPIVLETTPKDPGTSQTRRALAQDVDAVLALGGDGTVRAVAQALAGTSTPLGLLPIGSGTALARAVGLDVTDLEKAVEIALTGKNRHVDVGWVTLDPTPEQVAPGASETEAEQPEVSNRHAFLAMAGFGLDAAVLDETPTELRDKVGWTAYIPAGVKGLLGDRFRASLVVDGSSPIHLRARTIIVGNCGRLAGGVSLMPDAAVDDGALDVLAVTPKGVAGWAGVAANVLTKSERTSSRLDRFKGSVVTISVEEPQQVQMDGDVYGLASRVQMTVEPRALIVRTPA